MSRFETPITTYRSGQETWMDTDFNAQIAAGLRRAKVERARAARDFWHGLKGIARIR